MIDLKDLQKPMADALKMLEKTTKGLPERIKSLENVTAAEAEMLASGTEKISSVMGDIDKQMSEMKDYLKK